MNIKIAGLLSVLIAAYTTVSVFTNRHCMVRGQLTAVSGRENLYSMLLLSASA